jgi:hypothetical protein
MKMLALSVVLLLFVARLYSETQKEIEGMNLFGGKTISINYEKGDTNYNIVEETRLYYNEDDELVKNVSKLTNEMIKKTDFTFQEQQYENGKIIFYKMYMSDVGIQKHGYDYIIEYINQNGHVKMVKYGFGQTTITESTDNFPYQYTFLQLEYLANQILSDYEQNPKGDRFDFSAKYFQGRSLVLFTSGIQKMNDNDKKYANYYLKSVGQEAKIKYYNWKTKVKEKNKEYIVYIQDGLQQYCKNNEWALITFVVIGVNGELYPLLVAVNEVD